jgi:hypothetical protein
MNDFILCKISRMTQNGLPNEGAISFKPVISSNCVKQMAANGAHTAATSFSASVELHFQKIHNL